MFACFNNISVSFQAARKPLGRLNSKADGRWSACLSALAPVCVAPNSLDSAWQSHAAYLKHAWSWPSLAWLSHLHLAVLDLVSHTSSFDQAREAGAVCGAAVIVLWLVHSFVCIAVLNQTNPGRDWVDLLCGQKAWILRHALAVFYSFFPQAQTYL